MTQILKLGDILSVPFSSSGTTLAQALEMSKHFIGTDVSHFNCLIGESKLLDYDWLILLCILYLPVLVFSYMKKFLSLLPNFIVKSVLTMEWAG